MMPRFVPVAIAVVAILQTAFAIMASRDVARCEAAGYSRPACLRMVGG